MSENSEAMKLREEDVSKFLACSTHLGSTNLNFQMEQYVWKRRPDGNYVINLRRTWEKLLLAARAIAAIENPADICVISARSYGQRAILKFGAHTGATPIAGRWTPGTLTNQIQKAFKEPRMLVVTDPRIDHQAIIEASYVNIPVIAFCNTDNPLKYVDIAIPCNNKGARSLGLMWWMLAREVLLIRGKITRAGGFTFEDKEIMPDLYFYRDPEEAEKEEQAERGQETQEDWRQQPIETSVIDQDQQWQAEKPVPPLGTGLTEFNLQTPQITDWAAETQQWTASQTATQQWGGTTDSWQ